MKHMKYPILILPAVAAAWALAAQNVAVKWWASEPTNAIERAQGIPTNWPSAVVDLGTNTATPGPQWQLLTRSALSNHLASNRAVFQGWRSNYLAWQKSNETYAAAADLTNVLAQAAERQQLRQDVQSGYVNWTNLTGTQKVELLQKLLRLEVLRGASRAE